MNTFKFKPGKYYIGDPSYCFGKEWSKILKQNDFFPKSQVYSIDNQNFFVQNMIIDGTYYDDKNQKYFCDSGCLSVVPIELINEEDLKYMKGIKIIEIDKEFEVRTYDNSFRVNGNLIKDEIDDE